MYGNLRNGNLNFILIINWNWISEIWYFLYLIITKLIDLLFIFVIEWYTTWHEFILSIPNQFNADMNWWEILCNDLHMYEIIQRSSSIVVNKLLRSDFITSISKWQIYLKISRPNWNLISIVVLSGGCLHCSGFLSWNLTVL